MPAELCPEDALLQEGNHKKLSDYIWEGSLDLVEKAWDTTFITGIATGLLSPNFYATFILQDAVYCRRVAQLWQQLADDESVNHELREFAKGSIYSIQDHSKRMFDMWNVKDDTENNYGVIMREPASSYVTFIKKAMVAHAPNMLIATYACLTIWNTLTTGLLPIVKNATTNPYAVWVYENHGTGSSMRRQAAQMDEWDKNYHWYDWMEARDLFRSAMKHEIEFLEHAGNSSTSAALLDAI